MSLAMPSSFVDIERDEMEYVDGGYTLWQKALVAIAIVAAGVGLVVVLSYGQIWLAGSIMKISFSAAVSEIGITGVATIVGVYLGISATTVGAVLKTVF